MATTMLTITPADLFDLTASQVEATQREALRTEINRRWPDGLRLPFFLAIQPTN